MRQEPAATRLGTGLFQRFFASPWLPGLFWRESVSWPWLPPQSSAGPCSCLTFNKLQFHSAWLARPLAYISKAGKASVEEQNVKSWNSQRDVFSMRCHFQDAEHAILSRHTFQDYKYTYSISQARQNKKTHWIESRVCTRAQELLNKDLASMQMHLRHAAKCRFLAFSAHHHSSLGVVDGHSWPCMALCDQGNRASQPVVQSWTGICRAPEWVI